MSDSPASSPATPEPAPIKLTFARDTKVEHMLDQWRISWEYIADYPLDQIRTVVGQQVRDSANIARPETVAQYVEQAKNGAAFPPIVLAMGPPGGADDMVDGNTRVSMARKLDQTTFPAYRIKVSSLDYAKAVAAALNQLGGQRLTEVEIMKVALVMLNENVGFNDGEIAQSVGVAVNKVRAWRKTRDAEQHAEKLGVMETFDHVPVAQQKMLSRVVSDPAFKAIADLAGNRRVRNDDIRRLVDDVVNAPTEEIALERITDLADTLPAGGPKGVVSVANQKARRMRMLLPQILNLVPPAEVFETERADDDRKAWAKVGEVVDEMLAYYDERLPITPPTVD